MVWPARAFAGSEGVPGTRGRLGVLSVLPQGHGALVELTGLLNVDWGVMGNPGLWSPSLSALRILLPIFSLLCLSMVGLSPLYGRSKKIYDAGSRKT